MPDGQLSGGGTTRIRRQRGRAMTAAVATAGLAALTVAAASLARTPGTEHVRASTGATAASRGSDTVTTARTRAGRTADAAGASANWAGYTASGAPGQFTSVSTSWTQPAVTCGATNTSSSFWAGLDGDGTNTVEQIGTEADCSHGTAKYTGWWETFPKPPVFYDNLVRPGDAMTASVTAGGKGTLTLTLRDATQRWTRTTRQMSPKAQLGSAEIIAEAPSNGPVLPLSNFGSVTFGDDTVNGAPLGTSDAASLTMVSRTGLTEATPSALTDGTSFTVTWNGNGLTGPGAGAQAGRGGGGEEIRRRSVRHHGDVFPIVGISRLR